MILIEEILISRDIANKQFSCDLSACKGACCVEGDYGAPLEEDEILIIDKILPAVLPYLSSESKEVINKKGFHTINKEESEPATELMPDGACVFMGREDSGITYCSIEKAHRDGVVDFKKPLSCHLYPIRVSKNKHTGFHALNYDRWDICSPAIKHGKNEKVRIFEFNKEALIRAYGEEVYERLRVIADKET